MDRSQGGLGLGLAIVRATVRAHGGAVSAEDKKLLEEHAAFVREMEKELKEAKANVGHPVPQLEPGIRKDNDNIPKISKTSRERNSQLVASRRNPLHADSPRSSIDNTARCR